MAKSGIGTTYQTLMKFSEIEFTKDGIPKSVQFDDFYFSTCNGIEETEYVFITQNKLVERFTQLGPHSNFTIAETGFGTGLNFFVAWALFMKYAPPTSRLSFISCEKYPVSAEHLAKTHQHWPQFEAQSAQLAQNYPPALQGFHLLEFDRVNLTLLFEDAAKAFGQLTADVDAWFLDGFSPSKNPDMWQPELFKQVGRLSHAGTTLATFSSARVVRDGLKATGFKLTKIPGYGLKRHMMHGVFIGPIGPIKKSGWPSSELALPFKNNGKRVAIIGAGISGVTTAVELIKRGYDVQIFEQQDLAAKGGSGNSQGAVYAKLSAQKTVANTFYSQALIKAQQLLAKLPDDVPHAACGLVQLVHNERELKRLKDLTQSNLIPAELAQELNSEELSAKLNINITSSGLWFDGGGWVSPSSWVRHIIKAHNLDVRTNTQITDLTLTDKGWTLTSDTNKSWQADQVILTSAHDTLKFQQSQHLPLNAIAGQITQLHATARHEKLKAVICTDRYVMPTQDNQLTIGSTFRVKSSNTDITDADHIENIENLKKRVPSLFSDQETISNGRAAVRCTSPDYLPLVGAVCDPEQLKAQFRDPLHRNLAHLQPPATPISGLWVNVAHGSKGLCSSHLSSKLLASLISGDPLPVQTDIATALNPNRFIIRALIREERKKS